MFSTIQNAFGILGCGGVLPIRRYPSSNLDHNLVYLSIGTCLYHGSLIESTLPYSPNLIAPCTTTTSNSPSADGNGADSGATTMELTMIKGLLSSPLSGWHMGRGGAATTADNDNTDNAQGYRNFATIDQDRGGVDNDNSPTGRRANAEMKEDVVGRRDQLEDNAFNCAICSTVASTH
jgi:hypothetical protein